MRPARLDRRLHQEPYGIPALILRVLREYLPLYWKRYALSLALAATAAGCTALLAYLISHIVNQTYLFRNFAAIAALCAVGFAIVTLKGLTLYAQAIVLARVSNEIMAANQQRIFDKVLRESMSYFADRHSAEFINQLGTASGAIANTLSLLITAIGRDTLTVLALLAVMLVQDPVITIVALVTIPLAALIVRNVIKRTRAVMLRRQLASIGIIEGMQEIVRGLRTIKAFGLEDMIRRRLREQVIESRRAAEEHIRLAVRSNPLLEAVGGLALGLIGLYAGYRVIYTNATFGEFASVMAAFVLAYEPVKRLARLNITLSSSMFNVREFYELVDAPATEPDDAGKPELRAAAGRIAFTHVDFAYRADEPILRHMSFIAEAGRVTALVGPSGGGKSTALALILRLYEPTAGRIEIDQQNIADVSRASLRRAIAYVGQDVFLFRTTIRDNIAFGRPGASEAEIVAAATAAHAHDFIMSFPRGYDTPVGEQGLQLSTGQRQRVSIARALLKDAPLILLDEPTAALDSESEHHIQKAMGRLCLNRTTMVIAHRLQTIMHADSILFVEHGTVAESGSHQELLRRGGRYAAYYRLQFEQEIARQAGLPEQAARAV